MEITTKLYSDLYETSKIKDDGKKIQTTDEDILEVLMKEIAMVLKNIKNGMAGGN